MRLLPLTIRRYGVQFVGVGSLKFAADVLGFAGPLLLNRLVAFIEDAGEDVKWGYLYAALLTASAAAAALCNVHFNLLVSELNLKVRASVVSAVYRFALLEAFALGTFWIFILAFFTDTPWTCPAPTSAAATAPARSSTS